MTEGSEYYEYGALPSRHIRLLRLLPGHGYLGREGDIHVNLETQLLGSVEFDALSYTWGPPTLEEDDLSAAQIFTIVQRCYPIFLQGKILRVTKSLRDALRRLRSLEVPHLQRFFTAQVRQSKTAFTWADGLCINQDDDDERAQQVALMAEIYSMANLVLADIGDSDADAGLALEMAQSLHKMGRHLRGEAAPFGSLETPEWWQEYGLNMPTPEQWWNLLFLISRPWFGRTWVLQEVLLADGNRAVLLCGQLFAPLCQVLEAVALLYKSQWNLTIFGWLNALVRNDHRYAKYQDKVLSILPNPHPFIWIVQHWRTRTKPSFYKVARYLLPSTDCFDPRDKVYGTLGIASEWASLDPRKLPIDYSMTIAQVYCRATKYAVDKSHNLDMLTTVCSKIWNRRRREHQYDLPSWCPDYNESNPNSPLMGDGGGPNTLFSASGSSNLPVVGFDDRWN